MITFSERQLQIPKMSKPVYLVIGGMLKFGSTYTPAINRFKFKQKEA